MKRVDTFGEAYERTLFIYSTAEKEIDRLEEALGNPFMKREIKDRCKKRLTSLKRRLRMLKGKISLISLPEKGSLQDISRGDGTCES